MSDSFDALPKSFGKAAPKIRSELQLNRARRQKLSAIGPPAPEIGPLASDFEDSSSESDDCTTFDLPITHELIFKSHTKAVSALTFDTDGSRLYSGSRDYTVQVWDFNSMRAGKPTPVFCVNPTDSQDDNVGLYPIQSLDYCSINNTNAAPLLVIRSSSSAQLCSRDATLATECANGDPYIKDLRNTKGHTAELTDGFWKPKSCLFATCSVDGTVRVWDPNRTRQQSDIFVYNSRKSHVRTRIHTLGWSQATSGLIAFAASDASLNLWQTNSNKVQQSIKDAFKTDSSATCLTFSPDSIRLALRATDGTIAIWDIRNLSKTLAKMNCRDYKTNLIFSPDGKSILTSGSRNLLGSQATYLLDSTDLTIKSEIADYDSIRLVWNYKINQIAVGTAKGDIHVLFSSKRSINGARSVITRAVTSRHIDDFDEYTTSIDPTILEDAPLKRKRTKDLNIPEYQEQYTFQDQKQMIEDPREALLKYADAAEKNPIFTKHYTKKKL